MNKNYVDTILNFLFTLPQEVGYRFTIPNRVNINFSNTLKGTKAMNCCMCIFLSRFVYSYQDFLQLISIKIIFFPIKNCIFSCMKKKCQIC